MLPDALDRFAQVKEMPEDFLRAIRISEDEVKASRASLLL